MFIIFDEATNNVDRESEEIILKIMKRLAKDKNCYFYYTSHGSL